MPVQISTPPFSLSTAQRTALSNGISSGALEHIRRLIAGAATYGTDKKDLWGDAFIDADGRNNSVNAGSTTAIFSTNKYVPQQLMTGTLQNPNSITNPTNFFDGNTGTSATLQFDSTSISLGKTFTAATIAAVYVKASASRVNASGTCTLKLQKYDGASWTDVSTLVSADNPSYDGVAAVGASVQGLRVVMSANDRYNSTWTEFDLIAQSVVVLNIPTGTFPSNISAAVFKTLVAEYETGVNIEYKLTNAGVGDSGWTLDGATASFSAFATEPTTLTIRLTPKSGTTNAYPSIYGVAGMAW